MHYSICIMQPFSLWTIVVPYPNQCITRNMHYYIMHYEIINCTDMILMLSIDGAQLYAHKASDCWIYIWIILDHPPHLR